jgi:site-specific DNA-methyltransferase (adenine-specific)/modification methylase
MTEFSALRSSAGFELLDIAEQFDAPFPSVARWEIGLEDAPAQILEALRIASVGGIDASAGVENALLEGDCLELMKLIPDQSVNLVLCDLPYGTTQNRWDSVIDLTRLWREYRRVLKPNGVVVLTAQGVFTAKLILSNEDWFKYKIVWEKSKPTNFLNAKKQPLRKHEDVCVFYAKPPTYNPQMRPNELAFCRVS